MSLRQRIGEKIKAIQLNAMQLLSRQTKTLSETLYDEDRESIVTLSEKSKQRLETDAPIFNQAIKASNQVSQIAKSVVASKVFPYAAAALIAGSFMSPSANAAPAFDTSHLSQTLQTATLDAPAAAVTAPKAQAHHAGIQEKIVPFNQFAQERNLQYGDKATQDHVATPAPKSQKATPHVAPTTPPKVQQTTKVSADDFALNEAKQTAHLQHAIKKVQVALSDTPQAFAQTALAKNLEFQFAIYTDPATQSFDQIDDLIKAVGGATYYSSVDESAQEVQTLFAEANKQSAFDFNVSKASLNDIKHREALRLQCYDDGAGNWTIGYGNLGCVVDGVNYQGTSKGITKAQAEEMFTKHINSLKWELAKSFEGSPIYLTRGQQEAILDMAFNMGVPKLKETTFFKKASEGDVIGAAKELDRFKYSRKRNPKTGEYERNAKGGFIYEEMPGLVARSKWRQEAYTQSFSPRHLSLIEEKNAFNTSHKLAERRLNKELSSSKLKGEAGSPQWLASMSQIQEGLLKMKNHSEFALRKMGDLSAENDEVMQEVKAKALNTPTHSTKDQFQQLDHLASTINFIKNDQTQIHNEQRRIEHAVATLDAQLHAIDYLKDVAMGHVEPDSQQLHQALAYFNTETMGASSPLPKATTQTLAAVTNQLLERAGYTQANTVQPTLFTMQN